MAFTILLSLYKRTYASTSHVVLMVIITDLHGSAVDINVPKAFPEI